MLMYKKQLEIKLCLNLEKLGLSATFVDLGCVLSYLCQFLFNFSQNNHVYRCNCKLMLGAVT